MLNEIERVWRGMQNCGGGISDADNSIMKPSSLAVTAAEGILERQAVRRGALSPTTEPKVMQRLTHYVDKWGGRNVLEIFTKALMLLPPPLLEFYCGDHDTADTRGLSLPQFSELLGVSSPSASINEVARNTSHCVYVRVFPGGKSHQTAGQVTDIFESVSVDDGSISALELRNEVNAMPRDAPLLLTYVGYTTQTVKGRRKYGYNKLLCALWDSGAPMNLIAFELPQTGQNQQKSTDVLLLVEFLVVEMLGSFGKCGFNQEPGGGLLRYTGKNWASFEDARRIVQELGFTSKKEYHAWCTNNKDEKSKLGLPYGPDEVYANDGWDGWFDFLGKNWASF